MRTSLLASLLGAAALLPVAASAQPTESQPFTASGELELCDCRYGDHVVHLEAGRRYAISASSEAFDAKLRLYRAGSTELLGEDDDGGGELNPRLLFSPPESGDYLIRVVSYTGDGAGAYDLNIEALGPLPAPVTAPTRTEAMTWHVYEGRLEESDPADAEMRFDDYAVELEPGQSAFISLESEDFDPLVKVYAADQRGFQELAMDDDSGGGFNAFLRFTPDEGGAFIVRVTSFSSEGSGAYRLRIAR